MKSILLISVFLIGSIICSNADHSSNEDGEIWALLIAGSDGYTNYRHQSDVCHAYHVLRNHGIKEENIITIMYDDIANNPLNLKKGQIFNHPNGSDVYKGVTIDYRGKDVTANNFLAVLQGNRENVTGGNGRILETNSNDRIFVYFSDHGSFGHVNIIHDILTAKELNDAIKSMHKQKRYKELVFYIEACYSGSMFKGILSENIGVYAITAANANQSSYGTYCDTELAPGTCLGDEFSIHWMEDSDKKDLKKETLQTQYEIVRDQTLESEVLQFGDLKIAQETVSKFQGENDTDPVDLDVDVYESWRSRDIPIRSLESKLKRTYDFNERQHILDEIKDIKHKRAYLDKHIKSLVKKLIKDPYLQDQMINEYPSSITQLDCHDKVIHTYHEICFNFGKNPYAMTSSKVLTNLCEYGLDPSKIVSTLKSHCSNIKYKEIK